MGTEESLRAALQVAITESRLMPPDQQAEWLRTQVRDALSAHPARASQEPEPYRQLDAVAMVEQFRAEEQGELSDEQCDAIIAAAWAKATNAREFVRVLLADRAARPESVDARRYKTLRNPFGREYPYDFHVVVLDQRGAGGRMVVLDELDRLCDAAAPAQAAQNPGPKS